ncbi:MAG: TetR/AcrR family transcriptional regulator C-terminal domain-containing protein [Deltaproteobacteria bacterium]|nr:TetR/AcrR family transcriptional regulator C-terminal domain-containing protein [Deltaproteobacteria bacterium]
MVKHSGKREVLTREVVLRAALAVVDCDGLDALSMRRVGEALGVEAMSLYRYVDNKAAMLDGIFEAVLAELAPSKKTRSWRSALRARAMAFRRVLRAHPNALPVFATRPAVTDRALVQVEEVLEILRSAGFSVTDSLFAMQSVLAFVIGHTVTSYGTTRHDEGAEPAYSKLDGDRFARVREIAEVLPTHDVEEEFAFGLELLISGLRRRLSKQQKA